MILTDPDAHPVVAHRGASAHAPENTLEAFRAGVATGADALELDVHLSRDGVVMVHHDPTVERTTDGRGAVRSLTGAELQSLDAGYSFTNDGGRTHPWRGRGVRIPTLESVLREFGDIPLIVEIKAAEVAAPARALLERHGAARRVLIGSFLSEALDVFRGSGFARTASRADVLRLYARALLPGGPARLPYDVLCIPPVSRGIPLPVLRFARMARIAGVRTHVWTIDEPARALRYWAGGVNAIISNDPATILGARQGAVTGR